ncbi:MAG: phosphatase PAP2 family protein [bacterium]
MERVLQAAISFGERFKVWLIALGLLAAFCLLHYWLGGFDLTHLLFPLAVLLLYFAHAQSRMFVILAIPIILQNLFFDSFRYVPFHWFQPVHVSEPYHLDRLLFGIRHQGEVLLLNQYLLHFAGASLDFVCGVLYNLLDPMVAVILLLLWKLRSPELAERYGSAFLLMNFFAFATYLLYPAAAPWYVAKYGLVQPLGPVPGDAAGLANFDKIVGATVSAEMYQSSPVVFGAIPSMHAGFTMLGWMYSFHLNKRWAFGIGVYTVAMWFSAVYLQHHYVIDVILGIAYAVVAYVLIEKVFRQAVQKIYRIAYRLLTQNGTPPLFGGE